MMRLMLLKNWMSMKCIHVCRDMNIPYNLTNTLGFNKLKSLEYKYAPLTSEMYLT